ncbi:MAG TPA: protein phosphatase CheZ [Thiobacillaceae bacterium]|nr:protein phosphatase CheZ [Thiobacillaceae bacterium]HNU63374.1 protein phosphatase CheZ [Thiobacillaceae bacterium]
MDRQERLRQTLQTLVQDLRSNLQEIGQDSLPQAQLVTNTRDRLRYIASLTEQAASQTLNATENIGERLRGQRREASSLARHTRSPRIRAFLASLESEHSLSADELSEVIQAQAFQDLVGQVINKLLVTVERMEKGLAHLLIEEEKDPGLLAGPQVKVEERISQDDIDRLFD